MASRGDGRSYLVEPGDGELSRRESLTKTGTGATVVASAGLLAACDSSPSAAALSGSEAKPKRGGILGLALTGSSSRDTVDAENPVQEVGFSRVNNLYEPLDFLLCCPSQSLA
jgi:hypothetical protein